MTKLRASLTVHVYVPPPIAPAPPCSPPPLRRLPPPTSLPLPSNLTLVVPPVKLTVRRLQTSPTDSSRPPTSLTPLLGTPSPLLTLVVPPLRYVHHRLTVAACRLVQGSSQLLVLVQLMLRGYHNSLCVWGGGAHLVVCRGGGVTGGM